jgi:hypothetical protein
MTTPVMPSQVRPGRLIKQATAYLLWGAGAVGENAMLTPCHFAIVTNFLKNNETKLHYGFNFGPSLKPTSDFSHEF